MSKTITVVNVYEVKGMPEPIEERENAVVDSFSVTTIHCRNEKDGRYFLMRVTAVKPVDGLEIRKLEPEDASDMSVIDRLVRMIADNEPELLK